MQKTKFIKTVIGDVVAHLKPQKNHRFVRFVMYCIITTVLVVLSSEHVVMIRVSTLEHELEFTLPK